jgi:hypothetical protein
LMSGSKPSSRNFFRTNLPQCARGEQRLRSSTTGQYGQAGEG